MTNEEFDRIPYPSVKKKAFYGKYSHLTDSEVLKEILYHQELQTDRIERTRSNTSTLVWFLIVIPIIVLIVSAAFADLSGL